MVISALRGVVVCATHLIFIVSILKFLFPQVTFVIIGTVFYKQLTRLKTGHSGYADDVSGLNYFSIKL